VGKELPREGDPVGWVMHKLGAGGHGLPYCVHRKEKGVQGGREGKSTQTATERGDLGMKKANGERGKGKDGIQGNPPFCRGFSNCALGGRESVHGPRGSHDCSFLSVRAEKVLERK